jgi:hypothetical protein
VLLDDAFVTYVLGENWKEVASELGLLAKDSRSPGRRWQSHLEDTCQVGVWRG